MSRRVTPRLKDRPNVLRLHEALAGLVGDGDSAMIAVEETEEMRRFFCGECDYASMVVRLTGYGARFTTLHDPDCPVLARQWRDTPPESTAS